MRSHEILVEVSEEGFRSSMTAVKGDGAAAAGAAMAAPLFGPFFFYNQLVISSRVFFYINYCVGLNSNSIDA